MSDIALTLLRAVKLIQKICTLHPQSVDDKAGKALRLPEHGRQKVLGARQGLSAASCRLQGTFHNALGFWGKIIPRQSGRHADADGGADLLLDTRCGNSAVVQHHGGHTARIPDQPQQNMLTADVCVPHVLRGIDGIVQRGVGFFRKTRKFIHGITP